MDKWLCKLSEKKSCYEHVQNNTEMNATRKMEHKQFQKWVNLEVRAYKNYTVLAQI